MTDACAEIPAVAPRATVTVLVPVKTYEPRYLQEALGSILGQTSERWRMVIVVSDPRQVQEVGLLLGDDGRDERIAIVVEERAGLGAALNTGIAAAQTEFVAILLGDDMWTADAVEVLERYIGRYPEADFLHSARRIIGPDGESLSSVHPAPPEVRPEDFRRGTGPKHLLCWRRSTSLAIGGMDERFGLVGVDDFDFPWSMAEHGAVFHAVEECLYIYRDHRTGFRLTTHVPQTVFALEVWRIMRKHGVPRGAITRFLLGARRSFMRQGLYRTGWERRVREAVGRPPRATRRQNYS